MENKSTIATLAAHFVDAISPLGKVVSDLGYFKSYLYRLGWQVDSLPDEYRAIITDINDLKAKLETIVEDPNPLTISALLSAIVNFIDHIKSIDEVPLGISTDDRSEFLSAFKGIFLDLFLTEYVLAKFPEVYNLSRILGIIEVSYQPAETTRTDFLETRLNLNRIPAIILNPLEIPRFIYRWNTADFNFNLLIQHLDELFSVLGIESYIELDDGETLKSLDQTITFYGPYKLTVPFYLGYIDETPIELRLEILKWPAQNGKPPALAALLALPTDIAKSFQFGEELELKLTSESNLNTLLGFIIQPDSLEMVSPIGNPVDLFQNDLTISFDYNPSSPAIILGLVDGSRLDLKGAGLSIKIINSNGASEFLIRFELRELAYRLNLGEGDSFIQKITGGNPIEGNLSLELEFSSLRGINFAATGLIEWIVPSHIDLGFVKLESFNLTIRPSGESLPIHVQMNLKTSLGPLKIQVDKIGLKAYFTFPDDYSGNLGPLDLDIGFAPPVGIGLSIDGGGFKGGGFLLFDPINERYTGVLELEFQDKISLKAIGLLTTKLPGGEKGFSLLIIITAEFTPIQLGFGFTLNGVGGLLGLNRTAKIERLRTGVKDNTLSSILFPTDIVANANRIISDLRQVFPPQDNRFIFGPMAKIGWGSPTLITIDLGLMIEVPDPVRLVILGVVRAILPDEQAGLLRLKVNFLGLIDFEKEQLSFDASLYDSKLLAYTLSGDMAIRLNWGNDPNFLLTVGGFHPAYEPPPMNLPAIRKLTLQLLTGNNPRLTLETYFAITSNTAQFGAKLELYAGAGSFNVYGFLSFDALFQFNPFYFIAQIGAMLALRRGSSSIASIKLDLTLEGTTPWKANGTARLKLFWFLTVKVRFSKTFGEERNITFPDIEVIPLLEAALSDTGNWLSRIPTRSHLLVSLKQIEAIGDKIITHPFGILEVSQKVVPLNLRIDKFGNQKPGDGNDFHIQNVKIGTETQNTADTEEFFAPAQFFEKTDSEKLSSKSFEKYDSGIRIVDSEKFNSDYYAKRDVEYELFYIDSQRDQLLALWPDFLAPDAVAFNSWAVKGAIANSDLSFARNAKSALAPDEVSVGQESFAVVNSSDLTVFGDDSLVNSEAAALNRMQDLIQENPALEGNIQVVPQFEVNEL